tara:strand:+ start:141 stop:317 length:177 start_codon:yes stop_codon:yes gene_type:complete
MKVKELIDKLKSYNPQARVVVDKGDADDDDVAYSYIYDVGWGYHKDGEPNNKDLVELS